MAEPLADVMDALARIEIRLSIEDLNSAFTSHLDHNQVDELVALFTEDALYTHGERVSRGRAEIHTLFQKRSVSGAPGASGVRTARHLYSGLQIEIISDTEATGRSVCMTFAFDGPPPVGTTVPHLVADFEDRYRLCPDGRWRFAERRIDRIFVAPGNSGPVGQG